AVHSPQKVCLILVVVAPAMKLSVNYARIVPGSNPLCVDRISFLHEITALRKRIAAHAWNRSAPAGVLAHEIVDNVLAESRLEIDDVMRNSKLLAHPARIVHGVEGATRATQR